MATIDYETMSKTQRLAAFFIIVGPELAPELMKQLRDPEIEDVAREMATMNVVDFKLQEKIMDEFCGLIGDGMSTALGGMSFVQKALEAARGPQAASDILLRALPASNSIDAVRELSQMDTRQIFNLIKNEQPQTVAFILSYLDSKQVAHIVPLFSPQAREEIVERLGSMDSISSELIGKVLKSLGKHLSSGTQKYSLHRRGGAQAAAQLLNSLDKELSKTLLTRIEEKNAELGGAIRKKLFRFEDISRLSQSDVQRLLRDVETQDLALSLKNAPEPVKRSIANAMSKRAAATLKEEIELLSSARAKDVESAQDRVIAQIMQLSEAGEIDISPEE
ncbi:flagellar motor switch protein FliG [bacterium]|nr:flagellar motor switch protein FliG [bacterium]